ncbi:DUF7824 domain-containing protein [Herbidospora sp. RD11066]
MNPIEDLIRRNQLHELRRRLIALTEPERGEIGRDLPALVKELRAEATADLDQRNFDEWERDWELRTAMDDLLDNLASALLLAGLGTITGPAAAVTWITSRDVNRRWAVDVNVADAVAVAASRPIEWQRDVAVRLALRIRRPDDRIAPLAVALLRASGAEPPNHDPLVSAWLRMITHPGDPLTPKLLPRIFDAEGAGRQLRDEKATPAPTRWLARVRRDLPRDRAIEGCVSRFLRGGDAQDLRFFVRLHDLLAPTPGETAGRLRDYLRLLPSAPGTVAELAAKQVKHLFPLDRADLVEAVESLAFRPEAKLATIGLRWLDAELKRAPAAAEEFVLALTMAYGHTSFDVQSRAVDLTLKHLTDASLIADAITTLPTDLATRLTAGFGGEAPEVEPPPAVTFPPLPEVREPRPFPEPAVSPDNEAAGAWIQAESWLAAFVTRATTDRDALRTDLGRRLHLRSAQPAFGVWAHPRDWVRALSIELITPGATADEPTTWRPDDGRVVDLEQVLTITTLPLDADSAPMSAEEMTEMFQAHAAFMEQVNHAAMSATFNEDTIGNDRGHPMQGAADATPGLVDEVPEAGSEPGITDYGKVVGGSYRVLGSGLTRILGESRAGAVYYLEPGPDTVTGEPHVGATHLLQPGPDNVTGEPHVGAAHLFGPGLDETTGESHMGVAHYVAATDGMAGSSVGDLSGDAWIHPGEMRRSGVRLPEARYIPPMQLFLLHRFDELLSALRADELPPVLLATPTLDNGHLDPDVLVERLETCAEAGIEPLPADLAQALMRLPRGSHPAAAERAAKVGSAAARSAAEWLAGDGMPDPVAGLEWPEVSHPGNRRMRPILRPTAPTGHRLIDDVLLAAPQPRDYDGFPDTKKWFASMVPSHREVASVNYLPYVMQSWRHAPFSVKTFRGSLATDGPMGDASAVVLGLSLANHATFDAVVRLMLNLAARDALPTKALGRQLGVLVRRECLELPLLLTALTDLARAGAPRQVWDILRVLLPDLLPREGERATTPQTETLAFANDVVSWTGASGEIPEITAYAAGKSRSRFARECRRLRDQLTPP